MPSLPSLPLELLREILSYMHGQDVSLPEIPEPEPEPVPEPSELWAQHHGLDVINMRELQWQQRRKREADLLVLSWTCRPFRDIAQPMLHAFVSVRTGCDYDDRDEDAAACARFVSFVRTLASQPDLGRRVRHLEAPCSAAAVNDANDALLRDLFQAVPNLTTVHLFVGRLQALVPLEDGSDAPPPLPAVHPQGPPKLPASVHTLRLSGPETENVLDLGSPIFQHSCRSPLRVLELFGCSAIRPASLPDNVSSVPTLFHDLTTLNLRHTTMDPASFRSLLQTVGPGLASVSISVPREDYHERGIEITPMLYDKVSSAVWRCLRALLPWSDTLRSFAYTVQDHYALMFKMDDMSELANFVALETLWLEARCLRPPGWADPWAIVPPMVKSLRFSGMSFYIGYIKSLPARIAAGKFPRLKYLTLDVEDYGPDSKLLKLAREASISLREAGVHVTILPYVEYSPPVREPSG